MSKKLKSILPVILILIIAIFLRTYQLKVVPPGLYPDEAMNGNNALWSGFKVYYPENNGREGLFISIQALFIKIFGLPNEPWSLRLPSALFGTLTVWGLYLLGKTLFSTRIGLLASFFLATSFWHIVFSRIGFRAIMAPMLLIWSLFFLLKSLNQTRSNSQFSISNFQTNWKLKIKNWAFPAIAGALFGLGFYTYIAYRITPFLILLVLWYYWRQSKTGEQKQFLFSIFYFLFSAFLVALPLGLYYLQHPDDFFGRTAQLSVFQSETPLKDLGLNILKTAGMFNFVGDWNWRHNYAGRPELFWPVGMLFILGVAIGIKSVSSFKFQVLFLWLLLAAIPVVISNEGIPHALRSILMIPAVFMLAGLGAYRGYVFLQKHCGKWLKAFAVLFLSLFVLEAYQTYFVAWAENPNTLGAFSADYVAIGNVINALPKEVPKYVIVEASGVLVNGIPMPAQTVMFITKSYTPEQQKEKNIYYLLPEEQNKNSLKGFTFHLR